MKEAAVIALAFIMLLGGCESPTLEDYFESVFATSIPASLDNVRFKNNSNFFSLGWSMSASIHPKDLGKLLDGFTLRSDFSHFSAADLAEFPDPLRVSDFQKSLNYSDIPRGNKPLVKEYYKEVSFGDERGHVVLYTTLAQDFVVIRVYDE